MLKHIDEDDLKDKQGRPASPSYFDEISKNVKWYHRVLLNRPLKIVLVMLVVSLVVPPIVYFFLYEKVYVNNFVDDGYSLGICSHAKLHRVQCSVDAETEEALCASFCCYDPEDTFCYHTVPSRYSYISNTTWSAGNTLKPRVTRTPYGTTPNRAAIKLHVNQISETHLNFVIYDPTKVAYPETPATVTTTVNGTIRYKVYHPEVHIEIFSGDESVEKPLLSTARGALVTAEDFWEWNFIISDEQLYGLGELLLEPKVLYNTAEDSNSYPFIMGQRNGSFHGIYIQQSGPAEINHTGSMVLTVKSLAGHELGVHFFYGPTPEHVVRQFRSLVGAPAEPPYWALGVHFCRGNLTASRGNLTRSLEDFYSFSSLALRGGIPYDSDCIADGMFDYINGDVTSSPVEDIFTAADFIANNSLNFVPTLRPHLVVNATDPIYAAATQQNRLLLNGTSGEVYQVLGDGTVALLDYSINDTAQWLTGVWPLLHISNSFVLQDTWPRARHDVNISACSPEHFYTTQNVQEVVCQSVHWEVMKPTTGNPHRNSHNEYGNEYARAVRAVQGTSESFIMAASSAPGSAAATFQQQVATSWTAMKKELTRAVWAAMQGNYLHSVPVCGVGAPHIPARDIEALCIKWYLLSAFLPIFRVHSDSLERHPFAFSGHANNIMVAAMRMRYKLLPYMYGCLATHSALLRPMFYHFWNDNNTFALDDQFMVGEALVVAPNLRESSASVLLYVPHNETLYDLWGGHMVPRRESGWIEVPTLESDVTTLLRAGHIVPVQQSTYPTAAETRMKSNITLIVGLKCHLENGSCLAKGSMYVSPTSEWLFTADEGTVYINPWQNQTAAYEALCGGGTQQHQQPPPATVVDTIRVYGLPGGAGDYHESGQLAIDLCDYDVDYVIEHVL